MAKAGKKIVNPEGIKDVAIWQEDRTILYYGSGQVYSEVDWHNTVLGMGPSDWGEDTRAMTLAEQYLCIERHMLTYRAEPDPFTNVDFIDTLG